MGSQGFFPHVGQNGPCPSRGVGMGGDGSLLSRNGPNPLAAVAISCLRMNPPRAQREDIRPMAGVLVGFLSQLLIKVRVFRGLWQFQERVRITDQVLLAQGILGHKAFFPSELQRLARLVARKESSAANAFK